MKIWFHIEKLKEYIEKEDFKGFDPYDALNSPILRALSFKKKSLRILFIQSLKKSVLNVRRFLGIKIDYNPKGIGLILWGYSKLFKIEKRPEHLNKIEFLLELLAQLKSKGYSGSCWGYNFDWQSRAFYLPRFTPTVVNSSFIGHALLDTYEITKKEKALDMAISIKDFILYDLNRKEENSSLCFSYSPLDKSYVHNANLIGSSLLIRLYRFSGERILRDTALASLKYSMNYQKPDGSWHYAETPYQKWIDSFHTGFNLQSILYFLEQGFGEHYKIAFQKGVDFYEKHFFLEDGAPKYYFNKIYPLDIHSAAQAIVFFSRMGKDYFNLAQKVTVWMIENLQDKKGYFYYQKRRFFKVKIPYMRWAQAWAFHALTSFFDSSG